MFALVKLTFWCLPNLARNHKRIRILPHPFLIREILEAKEEKEHTQGS